LRRFDIFGDWEKNEEYSGESDEIFARASISIGDELYLTGING
jgi:hypothetical protein